MTCNMIASQGGIVGWTTNTSNLTNTVTSGGENSGRTINIFRNNHYGLRSKNFKKVFRKPIKKQV